jgi:microcystin-dependent protein
LTPYEIGNLTGTTEPLQIAIDALKTKTDTTNINLATTTTNANDALQRTQEISFSDDPTPQTNISAKCVLEEVVFTTDLNDISPTTFSHLQGCTSSIQNQLNSKMDSLAGTIIQHIKNDLQTNYPLRFLLCNGQNVSRTTYANLFSIIGITYGSGDGSTTFGIPDFQACFLRMASSARTVGGVVYTPNAVGTIQQDSLEAHVHSSNLSGNYLRSGSTSNTSDAYLLGTSRPNRSDFPAFGGGVSSSHRTSTETRPLNHSVYFYITC